ncbi:hypothetical protein EJ05DRAFT_475652 [Pseudovirgaria hyperparasitica]|uniref:Synaptobrevin n=1 Tax=Pseudovirgaria hyperparasitica TaxID=470096 RepID=A0A6A6WB34_9PEZI|nr:uncharacterized protein EJ05DRAFT_475652 [Pseudovirgaria hyperparasitica]KAF2758321.1 hypothetical protein EJ05DRAFT_475652 [Pseudovirgaria hyperparasitica]
MARLATAGAPPGAPDTTSINLERILSRLERTLLSSNSDPKLRRSGFERTKVGANLEHARSLLLRLEHESADIKIQSRKQTVQAELQARREQIKRLTQRLYELNQLDDSEGDSESDEADDDDDDDEDLFPSYAPAKHAEGGLETSHTPQNEALRAAAENLTSSIRARRPQAAAAATTEAAATSTTRGTTTGSTPFPASGRPTTETTTTATTEAMLSHNRAEQEDLTSSLFSMAQALKAQSVKFAQTLDLDKEVLNKTIAGLDKNTDGMDAAGRKMGTLRRMTEGKGWWARMQLYAIIAGLWFVAFAIVFILPKFRF